MRASQLDASRLDSELTAMLKEQFMTAFSLFQQVFAVCMLGKVLGSLLSGRSGCTMGWSV